MPYCCNACNFHVAEDPPEDCPECGGKLRFTMLSPTGEEDPQEAAAPDWRRMPDEDFERIEQPWGVRTAQMSAGIGFYFMVARFGRPLFYLLAANAAHGRDVEEMATGILILTVGIQVIAALVGGIVAGAATINWIPQGIGVGAGVLAAPVVISLIWGMSGVSELLITITLTTSVSVLGAYLGHLLIPAAKAHRSMSEILKPRQYAH